MQIPAVYTHYASVILFFFFGLSSIKDFIFADKVCTHRSSRLCCSTANGLHTTPGQCFELRQCMAPEVIRLLGVLGLSPAFTGCQTLPLLRLRNSPKGPLGK